MKRKTEIIFETEETIIIRQEAKTLNAFCQQCRAEVEMILPRAAAALSGFTEREVFRLIEADRIHFLEGERIFVCRNSLEIYAQSLNLLD